MTPACEGCKHRGCKRCETCSRNYGDRYEQAQKSKPTQESVRALTMLLTMGRMLDVEKKEAQHAKESAP